MSCKKLCLAFLLVCFIPAGCVSLEPKPDPSRFFSLTSLPRAGEGAQNPAGAGEITLGLGPVRLPGYLDRQQLVRRISQNRFAVAENDRWAEPLEENFSRVLSQNLSILLRTDRIVAYPWERSQRPIYQVQVEVLRFEPNAAHLTELWARWVVLDNGKKPLVVKESFLSQQARDQSIEGSVAAMSETVSGLSKEIAGAVNVLRNGQGR
jgi:uncharacterized lipoprotein YmbA